jgi:hypothetical protein
MRWFCLLLILTDDVPLLAVCLEDVEEEEKGGQIK